ncbi:MAG: hypothetical protein HZA83_01300, partial [Thaumarchaeota archaeon]|nr:hypothetical protein [Nitrososphaerota archaeon]
MRWYTALLLLIPLLMFGCSQPVCNTNADCSNSESCSNGKCVLKTNIGLENFSDSNYTACPIDNCMIFLCQDSITTTAINDCKFTDQKEAYSLVLNSWHEQKFMIGNGPTFLDFGEFAEANEYKNILPVGTKALALQCSSSSEGGGYLEPGITNSNEKNMCDSNSQCSSSGSIALCRNDVAAKTACITDKGELVECDCTSSGFYSTCGNKFIQNCKGRLGTPSNNPSRIPGTSLSKDKAVIDPGICQYNNYSGSVIMATKNLGFCEPSTFLSLAGQIITENPIKRFENDASYMGVKEFARFGNSPIKFDNSTLRFENKGYKWFSYQAHELLKRRIIPVFVTESSYDKDNNDNNKLKDDALSELAADMQDVVDYGVLEQNRQEGWQGVIIITVDDGEHARLVKRLCKNCLTALMVPDYDDSLRCRNFDLGTTGNRWGSEWNKCAAEFVTSQVTLYGSEIDLVGQRMLFDREAWSSYKSSEECKSDDNIEQTIFQEKISESKLILEKTNKPSILVYFGGRKTDYEGGDNCWTEEKVSNTVQYVFGNVKNLTSLGYVGIINMYYDDELLGENLNSQDKIPKTSTWIQASAGKGPSGLCALEAKDSIGRNVIVKCPRSMTLEDWVQDDPSSTLSTTYNDNGIIRTKDGYGINGYWELSDNSWAYKDKGRKNIWFNGCNAYATGGESYLTLKEVPE